MKTTLLLLVSAAAAHAMESAIPEAFTDARYQAMISSSPFALATPVAAAVVADKSFADGWFIAGCSWFDGGDYVTVRSRDSSVLFTLHGTEKENENGVRLHAVDWQTAVGKTTATIVKDGQFAKLEMLELANLQSPGPLAGAAVNPGMAPRQGIPNPSARQPPSVTGQPNVPQQPRSVIPRPSGQPIISPQPSYQVTPGYKPNAAPVPNNPTAAPAGEPRRRIRMIPSPTAQ